VRSNTEFDAGPDPGTVRIERPPSNIDFALAPTPERSRFEALLLADTQPANAVEMAYLRDDILRPAHSLGAALAINHGDVVFDDLSLYPHYLQLLGASETVWHHCPGNHDLDLGAPHDRWSRETWKQVFGPRHYAFQYACATFIVLDNVYYCGRARDGSAGEYRGRIGVDQLAFVRNVLAHVPRDMLVVLSMHIPLVTYQDASNPADNTSDACALLSLLSDRPHSVSFSGHMHSTEHHYLPLHGELEGQARRHHHHVLTAASGGWWGGPKDARGIPSAESPDGNPNGFHVLGIDGRNYSTRFVPAPEKASAQMRLTVERAAREYPGRAVSTCDLPHCALVANVFDGGPLTRVTFEIENAGIAARPMQRIAALDPFVVQKPWARPVPSSHIWKAPLPAGLPAGNYVVTVRATDEYCRPVTAHRGLDIARSP
jgi:hypothetical protein